MVEELIKNFNFYQLTDADELKNQTNLVALDLTIQEELIKKKFQQKTIEIAFDYNQQSIVAVTNIFGDFVTLLTIMLLFIINQKT